MKRQPYFPRQTGMRPEWFGNFASELALANTTLALPAPQVAAAVADARYCEYACGPWLTAVRDFGPAATESIEELLDSPGAAPHELSVFTAPPLPAGVTAVPSGALGRIFTFVQAIKASPHYTEAIGLQMGIVGHEDAAENPVPTFSLEAERHGDCECVRVNFKKYRRQGVVIPRGGGPWEMLAIDLSSPYLDARPLLAAAQPEIREYRLQYYDDAAPVGDFTAIESIAVRP